MWFIKLFSLTIFLIVVFNYGCESAEHKPHLPRPTFRPPHYGKYVHSPVREVAQPYDRRPYLPRPTPRPPKFVHEVLKPANRRPHLPRPTPRPPRPNY